MLGLAAIAGMAGLHGVVARSAAARVAALAPAPGSLALALADWRVPLAATVFVDDGAEVRRFHVPASGPPLEQARARRAGPADAAATRGLAARMRLPVVRAAGADLVVEDAQYDAIDPRAGPFRIVVGVDGARVEQRGLGLQPLLYGAVLAGVVVIGRRRSRGAPLDDRAAPPRSS